VAVNIGSLEGLLILRDRFTGPLKKATGQLDLVGKKMQAIGQKMSTAGASMTRAITVPIVLIGGAAVVAFAKFDDKMTESIAIMGDVSDAMKEDMAKVARATALTVEASATDMAEGYFFLASAGLDAAASIEALPVVAKFAQAGIFGLALATDLLTDAQSALGLTIKDDVIKNMENMTRISDVLVKANTLANASVEQFSTALTTEAGAALKSFNKDVEEGVAVLAAFADQGVKGQVAGTGLSRILRLMTAAAVKNSDAYEMLGVDVFDASGKMNNMADIVEDLENALGDMSDESRTVALDMLGFKARVQGVILPLIGTSDAIRRYEAELRKAGGTTEEVAAKQMQSFLKQMKLVGARIIDVAIGLGSTLAPTIKSFAEDVLVPAIDKLAAFAKWFGDLPDPVRNTAIAVTAMAAAAGPVVFILGNLTVVAGLAASSVAALGNASLISAGKLQTLGLWAGRLALPLAAIATLFSAIGRQNKDVANRVAELTAELASGSTTVEELRVNFERLAKVLPSARVSSTKLELAALRKVLKDLNKPISVVVDRTEDYSSAAVEADVSTKSWMTAAQKFLGPIKESGVKVLDLTKKVSSLAKMLDQLSLKSISGAASNLTEMTGAFEDNSEAVRKNEERFQLLAMTMVDTSRSQEEILRITSLVRSAMIRGVFDADDFAAALGRINDKGDEAGTTFSTLSTSFADAIAQMVIQAESFGDALEAIFVGRARAIFSQFVTTMLDSFSKGMDSNNGLLASIKGGWKEAKESVLGTAAGITAGIAASFGKSQDIAIGAMSAIVNFASGNWVAGMAAAIGTVIGLMKKFKGNPGLTAAKKFGLALSEALVSSITDFARALGRRGGADAALRQFLGDAIREVGIESGLDLRRFTKLALLTLADLDRGFITSAQTVSALGDSLGEILDRFEDAGGTLLDLRLIGDVFMNAIDQVRRGQLTAAEATQILNDNFGAFIDAALTLGPKGAEAILRVADAARAAGLEISSVTEKIEELTDQALEILAQRNRFLVEQAAALIGGVETLLAATGDANRREIEFTVSAVVAAFNAMMEAGAPILEIIELLGESFSVILERGLELGLELPEAFRRLGEIIDVVSSRRLTRLLGQLDGVAAATAALGNMGVLTADQFDFFGDSIRRSFRRLVASGLTAEEALAILAPQLQQLNDLSQQYGFELDKNTQSLLDQALAQGVVADKGLSMEDILIKGFDRLLIALNALIEAMGGVPVAFEEWGDAASAAGDDISRLIEKIDNVDIVDFSPGGRPTDPKQNKPFFRHGSGGLRNFSALGTPAILHGSEEVLTAKQGGGVAAMVSAAISGDGGGRGDLLADSIDELSRSLIRQQASVEIQRRDESLKSAA